MSTDTDTRTEPTPLWRDYCGTSFANAEHSFTFDTRLGRCYELAAFAMAFGDLDKGILVHGSIHGPGATRRIGHGWVLLGNGTQVWEPITGRCYDREEWYRWTAAEEEKTYKPKAARLKMIRTGTYGRWHDSPHP